MTSTAVCAYCEAIFEPISKSKFCSWVCRKAAVTKQFRKVRPTFGPCPTCGIMFQSRYKKTFCSMKCYTKSEQFQNMVRNNVEKALIISLAKQNYSRLPRKLVKCLECEKEFYVKPREPRKFCSRKHYREYMAARFDRWIASPEAIALPQNYDEFLTKAKLDCLVAGCSWSGVNLSTHMNRGHGVIASEFKRAAGFNQKTGVVTAEYSEHLSARPHLHEAPMLDTLARGRLQGLAQLRIGHPVALEGREHYAKSRLLLDGSISLKTRICCNCGKEFTQSNPYGLTKYCSVVCRNKFYKRARSKSVVCGSCNLTFTATPDQIRRATKKGKTLLFCSKKCFWVHNKSLGIKLQRRIKS